LRAYSFPGNLFNKTIPSKWHLDTFIFTIFVMSFLQRDALNTYANKEYREHIFRSIILPSRALAAW
jgi:hypothetical protein